MKVSKALKEFQNEAKADGAFWGVQARLDFAIALECQRRLVNITYAEIAKRIGASAAYISKVFRGDASLTIETMSKLAESTGGTLEIRIFCKGASPMPSLQAQPAAQPLWPRSLSNDSGRDGCVHALSSSPVERVERVEVLYVQVERGTGAAGDEARLVHQYWSMDGRLLAERDPINEPG